MEIENTYLDTVINDLRESNRGKSSGPCRIFSVMGPAGAGKTTLTDKLQQRTKAQGMTFYVENASANPYLTSGVGTGERFNADARQRWFVDQYADFFRGWKGQGKIFLDQDPCAVGLVFSRCLQAINFLTKESYSNHLHSLLHVERTMSEISACRKIIALEAPVDVLVERLRTREPGAPISAEWVAKQDCGFRWLYSRLEDVRTSNFVRLDSDALSEDEVEAEALRIIGFKDWKR